MKFLFSTNSIDSSWEKTGEIELVVFPKDLEARNKFSCALENSRNEEREELSPNDLMLCFVCRNVFTADEKYSITLSANCSQLALEYRQEMPQFKDLLMAIVDRLFAVAHSSNVSDEGAQSKLDFIHKCMSACE